MKEHEVQPSPGVSHCRIAISNKYMGVKDEHQEQY